MLKKVFSRLTIIAAVESFLPLAAMAADEQKLPPAFTKSDRVIVSALRVSDVENSVKFYVASLGMHEKGKRRPTSGGKAIEVTLGYTEDLMVPEIMLLGPSSSPVIGAKPKADTLSDRPSDHWIILGVKDVREKYAAAAAAGGKVVRPPTENAAANVVVGFVEDLDGNRFELVQFP